VLDVICLLITVYVIVIFVRIVLTWFPLDPDGGMATVAGFLFVVTDPVLGPIRRALPPLRFGNVAMDLSPIIVLIGLRILQGVIGC
jgi:YggT family protein